MANYQERRCPQSRERRKINCGASGIFPIPAFADYASVNSSCPYPPRKFDHLSIYSGLTHSDYKRESTMNSFSVKQTAFSNMSHRPLLLHLL